MQAAEVVQPSSGAGTPFLVDASAAHGSPSESTQPPAFAKGPATRSKTIVLADAGRAPWYNAAGQPLPPYLVGIAGGSASGKTSVARAILKQLPNVPWVAILSQDAFYRPLSREQSKLAFQDQYDFDHPDAFDHDLLKACIKDLRNAKAVEIPVYSFVHHNRTAEKNYLYGPAVLIVEGIFVLHDPEIRKMLDLKIFVQADSDLMLARRIRRDILERGRSVTSVIDQYLRYVKPAFDNHVATTSRYADMIVPGANNEVAIEVISQHMEKQLKNRAMRLRTELSKTPATPRVELQSPFERLGSVQGRPGQASLLERTQSASSNPDASHPNDPLAAGTAAAAALGLAQANPAALHSLAGSVIPSNVLLLAQTPQLRSLLTMLHDRSTPTSEFTFACKRVGTLVVERATTLLPYRQRTVHLHTGGTYLGTELDISSICSVAILRSGSVLEPSLRRAFPAMSLGSLLIQSNEQDGEPYLYDVALPSFIRNRATAETSWVLLLDAQIGTGAAAFMAIRVLLDHSVPEEQIVFLTLLASAKAGIHALHRAFPRVRIVVAGLDPGLEKMRIPIGGGGGGGEERKSGSEGGQAQGNRLAMRRAAPPRVSEGGEGADGVEQGDGAGRVKMRQPSLGLSAKESRVVFAITPGCGSIGDRFWGTGST